MRNNIKILGLGVISATMLASCANPVAAPVIPDVTGDLVPGTEWPFATQIGVISATEAGDFQYSTRAQVVDVAVTNGYAIELPVNAPEGIYQVVGWVDADADAQIEDGEVLGTNPDKFLVFADGTFDAFGRTFQAGWNLYDQTTNTVDTAVPFTDYDLFRSATATP